MKNILILFLISFGLSSCSAYPIPQTKTNWEQFQKTETLAEKKEPPKENKKWEKKFPEDCIWNHIKKVIDGDTIETKEKGKIRLIGIDTPESKHPNKPVQKGALEAYRKLTELLSAEEKICLLEDGESDQKDKYDRWLYHLFTSSGQDIAQEMLVSGLAKGYFYFPFARKAEFQEFENQAKTAHQGLWQKD